MNCLSCKYFEQGKNGCFCGNPNQENESYKTYVPYFISCSLFEKGISKNRVDGQIKFHQCRITELEKLKND